jgi:hypothetical protein
LGTQLVRYSQCIISVVVPEATVVVLVALDAEDAT